MAKPQPYGGNMCQFWCAVTASWLGSCPHPEPMCKNHRGSSDIFGRMDLTNRPPTVPTSPSLHAEWSAASLSAKTATRHATRHPTRHATIWGCGGPHIPETIASSRRIGPFGLRPIFLRQLDLLSFECSQLCSSQQRTAHRSVGVRHSTRGWQKGRVRAVRLHIRSLTHKDLRTPPWRRHGSEGVQVCFWPCIGHVSGNCVTAVLAGTLGIH